MSCDSRSGRTGRRSRDCPRACRPWSGGGLGSVTDSPEREQFLLFEAVASLLAQ